MLETVNGCDNLIHLLKKSISEKKAIIHRYYQYKDDALEEKQELEKLMFASCYNISTVSLETINDIIDSFSISNDSFITSFISYFILFVNILFQYFTILLNYYF